MAELPEYLRRINEEKEKRTGHLNLGNCGLTDWPDELFDCYWLEHLVMSDNYIWDNDKRYIIDEESFDSIVDISNLNSLSFISPGLNKLPQLKSLYAGGSYAGWWYIAEIACLENLRSLEILDLSHNRLMEIKGLEYCTNLHTLILSGNGLTEIEGMANCTNLRILNLASNQIKSIKGLENCPGLRTLNLAVNEIEEIKGFEECANLHTLNLASNNIQEIKGFINFPGLHWLDFSNNNINQIKGLEQCTALHTLILNGNQIREIKGLENCSSLQELDLNRNKLGEIKGLESCALLKKLNVSANFLNEIKGLNFCRSLQVVYLFDNFLKEIKGLENCMALRELDISMNNISLIENIDHLIYLDKLRVKHNPLKNFPQELHDDGYPEDSCYGDWKTWQAALREGHTTNYQVKMMFCGNSNTGKSSIVEALKKGYCSKSPASTHGIVIDSELKHNGDKVIYTWDMGGQEIYHGTHRLFMQGNALHIAVFDAATESACFTQDRMNEQEIVRNHPLEYWLDMLGYHPADDWSAESEAANPAIIVQNKVDGKEAAIHDKNNMLANQYNLSFAAVSAQTGYNIDLLKFYIDREVVKLPEYEMLVPQKWAFVRDHFLAEQKKEKSNNPIITLAGFEQTAAEYGIAEWAMPVLLKYLHNSGIVYHSRKFLNDHIIIHQKWALDIIYRVLEKKSDFYAYMRHHNQGFCQLRYLWKEWGGTEDDSIKKILTGFMRSCAICFPLHTRYSWENYYDPSATYVFPEFLTRTRPFAVAQKLKDRAALPRYYYRYQHHYIGYKAMQQLLVEYGCRTGKELYWRNGLMVIDEISGAFTMLEYNEAEAIQTLTLTADDNMDRALAKNILAAMNAIIGHRQEGWSFSGDEENWSTINLEQEIENIKGAPKEFPQKEDTAPLKIAISYAKEDNSSEYGFNPFRELVNNLRIYEANNQLRVFCDENIDESNWDNKIRETFKEADLVIILNSMYYNMLQKKYIWNVEMPIIEELYKQPGLHVLRMNVSECNYRKDVLGKFYDYKSPSIPKDKQERDKYFHDFIQQQIFEKIINKKQ